MAVTEQQRLSMHAWCIETREVHLIHTPQGKARATDVCMQHTELGCTSVATDVCVQHTELGCTSVHVLRGQDAPH